MLMQHLRKGKSLALKIYDTFDKSAVKNPGECLFSCGHVIVCDFLDFVYLYGGPQLSRQQQKAHGKSKKFTAKTKCSRQKHNAHGENKNGHGKNKMLTATTKCSRQKQNAHGKNKKLTAKTK